MPIQLSRIVQPRLIYLKEANCLDTHHGIERFYKKLIELNLIRDAIVVFHGRYDLIFPDLNI